MRKPPKAPGAIKRAQAARKAPSVAEAILWEHLRNHQLGFKFRREVPFGIYRLDFYCAEAKLCVELDGEQHREEVDALRDEFLATYGIETLRIPNADFLYLDRTKPWPKSLAQIQEACEARTGRKSFE